MKTPKEVRAYVGGSWRVIENVTNGEIVTLEVELDDGRTVQLCVDGEGRIQLRAWGNMPAKLANMNRTSFSAIVSFEEQTHEPVTYERLDK